MARYKCIVEYDGGGFVGWQRQDNGLGVQQVVEEAIARLSGCSVVVHAAGRTDSGVHALGQAIHFDLPRAFSAETIRDALNYHAKPHAVAVLEACVVDETFHARFSARERRYLYRILDRRPPPVLDRGRVWWVARSLDESRMAQAALMLLGRHDFSTFRATICQAASPVKTLDALEVSRVGPELHVRARARSFLHHQVRNMVGALRLVGEGKWSAEDLRVALEARDRRAGGPTAPAEGLYLTEVVY